MRHENQRLEYKRQYTEDIRKTVLAFANTDGGDIYVGIADDGTVLGIEHVDDVMLQIVHSVRDTIRPDLTTQMICEPVEMDGKVVVRVHVQRGVSRPYYLAAKGIRPDGVFLRVGASSVPASESAIVSMIRETGGDRYELLRSLQQELTFIDAEKAFADEHVPFGPEKKRTLGLVGQDGNFTNLGLLLSDQCPHTIRAAVFSGTAKRSFQDRAEFTGSLFHQLDEAFRYISQFNHIHSELAGLKRVDRRNYPVEAVREALLNAIVHREYAFGGSTLISLFDDRMEIVTLGGLPKGITFDDLSLGVSVLRNPGLADVFYRLNLIEAYGTGIPKMMESYHPLNLKPIIETSDNAFRITLPNVNRPHAEETGNTYMISRDRTSPIPDGASCETGSTTYDHASPESTFEEEQLLQYLAVHRIVSRQEVQMLLGVSQATAVRILNRLIQTGTIVKSGSGRKTRYRAGG